MANVAVIYHSGYGHNQRVAQFVLEGVKTAATAHEVVIDAEGNVSDADWAVLDAADAIVFGSPTYMGMASWQFKKFADASSKRWFTQGWKDKIAGGFTISASPSGDKFSTLRYFFTLAMQHGMIWVSQTVPNDGTLNRLGSYGGLMAQVGPTSPPADIPQGDLDTARAYGQRIAEFAHKVKG
ncbi:flavodoxin family protein [Amphibiibacter pelophylacis]|uniref:Flavodoxin family protein n=1 Tax=Amphibiibacter pelophylacis TaxID=1799477 RepID=A0ACC6P4T2_9BURK